MRVFIEAAFRGGDAHTVERGDGAGFQHQVAGIAVVGAHGFHDLVAHGEDRVQAGHRFLEDHRDAAAAQGAHFGIWQGEQILAVEHDAAGGDAAGGWHQAHGGERQHGFAAAAFADDAEGFAPGHRERHPGDRRDFPRRGAKDGAQVFDGEQVVHRHILTQPSAAV